MIITYLFNYTITTLPLTVIVVSDMTMRKHSWGSVMRTDCFSAWHLHTTVFPCPGCPDSSHTHTHTHTHTDRQTHTHTHTHTQTDRQTHTHTHRQTDRHTHTHTHCHYQHIQLWLMEMWTSNLKYRNTIINNLIIMGISVHVSSMEWSF